MSRWPTKQLRDLAETVMGQAPPGSECNFDRRGIPFVKAGEFGESRPLIREWTTRPLKFAKSSDVLVCVVGATCGKLNLGADCAIGRSVAAIRPDELLLNQRFLYAFLQGWTLRLRSGSQGSAQGVITRDMLHIIPIPTPPLAEQERIANLLDEADELRKLRTQADRRTDDLIPALFHEMFGAPTEESKQWPMVCLGQVCEFIGGASLPTGVPFVGQTDGLLLLKVGDMNESGNETFITTSREWTALDISTSSRAKKGTVIIPKRGGAIATNKKRMLLRAALLDPNLMGIYPDDEKLTADYLYEWFRLFDLTKITSGSAVPQLNKQDLSPLKIAIPPANIQNEFVQRVNEIRDMEAVQSSSRQRFDALFQSMLHRAFNGET